MRSTYWTRAAGLGLAAVIVVSTTACGPSGERDSEGAKSSKAAANSERKASSSADGGSATGGADASSSAPSSSAAPPADPETAPDKGAIVGVVKFKGTPPKVKPINFGAERQCADLHKTPPIVEKIVVNPNGTVKWTLVAIKGRLPGEFTPPAEPAVYDQAGCVFVPHVLAVMEGQEIEFRNSDPVTHNVRANPKLGKAFNMVFPAKGSPQKERMAMREVGIPVKCDIHFWMSGYIHVLKHPYFAVTSEDGTFTIRDVPPGTYTLETWHEALKPQAQEVTIEAGKVARIDFEIGE
ncbi:MAG: hypothetical protein FJ297_07440 [Planctomycetes bacterium]|nr:hypothetical protein [Planctomycetota bacterium]